MAATRTLVSAEQDSRVTENLSPKPETSQTEFVARRRRRRRAVAGPPDLQLPLMTVVDGGRAKSDGAYGAAGQRLWDGLSQHADLADRRRLLDLVASNGALVERATFAELRQRGDGLALLLAEAGADPPAAATGG